MNKITDTQLMIIDKEGHIYSEPDIIGKRHQEIIEEYAKKKHYEYSNVEFVTRQGNVIFYNVGHHYVATYLPSDLTEEQLYQLDLLSTNMDDIEYMETRKFTVCVGVC